MSPHNEKRDFMKFLLFAATVLTAVAPAIAADVGVSISIGQPGFYGRIDIGNAPQPRLINSQPIVIERQVRYVNPPLYLRVPPGHTKDWAKHCRKYNACNQQVYFVHDDWYNDVYVPQYHDKNDKHGKGHGKGDDKGNGNGNGKGKGRDKD
jgi:hypothetical protein